MPSRDVIAAAACAATRRVPVQDLTMGNTPPCPSIAIDRSSCGRHDRHWPGFLLARPPDMAGQRLGGESCPTAGASVRKLQPGYLDRQGRDSIGGLEDLGRNAATQAGELPVTPNREQLLRRLHKPYLFFLYRSSFYTPHEWRFNLNCWSEYIGENHAQGLGRFGSRNFQAIRMISFLELFPVEIVWVLYDHKFQQRSSLSIQPHKNSVDQDGILGFSNKSF
jgi:hypothetical protein